MKKYTILIIEDELMLQQAYKMILEHAGHTVMTANNGVEGLDQVAAHKFDVILLDMLMPKMGGMEFMKATDVKTKHPDTKIILFSNLSNESHQQHMDKLGVDKQFLKSKISPKELVQIIDETVAAK